MKNTLRRGEDAADKAGGVFGREDAGGGERLDRPAVAGRVVAEKDDGTRRLRGTDVRVAAKRVGRERPERERRGRRAEHQIAQAIVFLAVKVIDIKQLL